MPPHPIIPVILSGGAGTRLWPASTPDRPKQLHNLLGDRTMLQATVARTPAGQGFDHPLVVTSARHEQQVRE